ncbi:MAG: Fe-S oxidoreductase [Methanobacterium sp. Maddingley MBC34]|nr:MAG: Fe-S oxidoreductase [Methanobacterium sp. Maddingley MBC34]
MDHKSKRILFFNAKREKCDSDSPHIGLAMLAAVLKSCGHEVLVVDYQFNPNAPDPKAIFEDFKPDVVGLTIYTATMKEADIIFEQISQFNKPIIVGGPHATLYSHELVDKANYIIVGEAENIIVDVVENADVGTKGKIICSEPPDPQKLPFPDFTSFVGHEDIFLYPLLTSRGCPYNCSFCAVRFVSTRKWRPKSVEKCIEEIISAKKKFDSIGNVVVYDDNAMFRKNHIKKFLKCYINSNINLPLTVINTRADSLDDEIVSLLKKAKCPHIGIGVESGHPEVFKKIGKGETLDDIIRAAGLIKKHKMTLDLCFVIGLEDDSLENTRVSIEFAKKLKPDHIYWNMITPFEGTKIREWYDKNGKVFDLINHSSLVDGDFMCEEPCAETPEFSIEERKKAYLIAILETNDTRLSIINIPRLYPYVQQYGLYNEFLRWIPKTLWKSFKKPFRILNLAIKMYPEVGLRGFIKRFVKIIRTG